MALTPQKPNKIEWKLLLLVESDFFSFKASLFFYSILIESCYLFSRKSRNIYFFKQTRLLNGQALKELIIWLGRGRGLERRTLEL